MPGSPDTQTRDTFCRICESLCGLEVEVERTDSGERIRDIRPNEQHVATGGFACLKGLHQHKLYDSPDRLEYPEKRVGDRWERISWAQALGEIGAKVAKLRGDHGADSIGMYVGTAAGFSMLHPLFAQGFMQGLGSKSMYAPATQDCANKFAVAHQVYGFPFSQPYPDVDRTECLIIVGANPVVSKWSFLQVPNPVKRLREIQGRGGRVIVVDPRRTETAKIAGEHVFIKPDTDVFFYLSFLNVVIERGGVDRARVAQHMKGFEAVEALVREWTPERTERVTRIPAETLREMVDAYLAANGAALYSSTGVNMGTRGSLCFWLQEVINAVTGNLDRPGGTLMGEGIVDFARFGVRSGMFMDDKTSRIGGFRAVNDAFPGGVMADEILTPGDRQLRALFVTGGNPLITMANSGRLAKAFGELELLVTLDIYRNETGSLAHYILPCTTPFERPDILFAFPLLMGMQSRPYLQATEAVHAPRGEQRDEPSIYVELAKACGSPIFGSSIVQKLFEGTRRFDTRKRSGKGGLPGIPQEWILSLLLRLGRVGSYKKLLESPNGVARPPVRGGNYLGERIVTEDKKVDLSPDILMEAAGELETAFERELSDNRLRLITKRTHETHNSWTHNIEEFVSGERNTNHLYMHPEDARKAGLENGGLADVRSATATVRIPVRTLSDLMPGTVAMPHGWGHQHAGDLSVASKTAGVNVNLLAADGPDAIERIAGMAHLTGIPVDVFPAAGPRAKDSWSGIAE
ncbi:MAG: molybdopterin-dependent oxidoreductase [Myxococcota bacterium]|nr:molybdopterin-dependent oxidoreductase [Myxococcota bacterium]